MTRILLSAGLILSLAKCGPPARFSGVTCSHTLAGYGLIAKLVNEETGQPIVNVLLEVELVNEEGSLDPTSALTNTNGVFTASYLTDDAANCWRVGSVPDDPRAPEVPPFPREVTLIFDMPIRQHRIAVTIEPSMVSQTTPFLYAIDLGEILVP